MVGNEKEFLWNILKGKIFVGGLNLRLDCILAVRHQRFTMGIFGGVDVAKISKSDLDIVKKGFHNLYK